MDKWHLKNIALALLYVLLQTYFYANYRFRKAMLLKQNAQSNPESSATVSARRHEFNSSVDIFLGRERAITFLQKYIQINLPAIV